MTDQPTDRELLKEAVYWIDRLTAHVSKPDDLVDFIDVADARLSQPEDVPVESGTEITVSGDLCESDESLDKIHCELKHGVRIYLIYRQDIDFWREEYLGESTPLDLEHSGLLLAGTGRTPNRIEDPDDFVICLDQYPTEKCDIEVAYVQLGPLLDHEDLVAVIDRPELPPESPIIAALYEKGEG